MGLFERRKRRAVGPEPRSFAEDATAMRATLSSLQSEIDGRRMRPEIDLLALVRDLLEGEVAAPTQDVRKLVERGTDPREFYQRELAPSWEGLSEVARAARVEGFIDLRALLESNPDGLPPEMAMTVRTKLLLLAWAFDETYGFSARLAGRDG